ncbi:NAD(+)/NADH kinase [Couchioplanes caeruleus]|uniref:NAD kinase n=2 Tax=Couchioplanes caeruleus TaxID=56438 RepID=A0A1K0GUM4_9ACTN|nr:NAD(+)/NADH kinase [Couchioplanes caeruleus]OJF13067.1 ATP-NAD kinase [Couchioplanes caeruleus subsp. caeruleus]ROP32914.1 NAD+ kinase [Couchioplanes caeruleus]
MGMVKVVGLVLHPRRDCGAAIDAIVRWAASRDVTVLGLHDEITRIDCAAVAVSAEEMVERAGLLVSLGGDGTMLRTMRLVEGRKTPVLGVNVGRLGFLAEVDLPDLAGALSTIDDHGFTVESRTAVRTVLPDGREVSAFNDIAMVRVPGHGLAHIGINVEGSNFVRYAADAVIVATPTGSTAYSFSAGGPIVSPNVAGILVTASAAHSSFNRSLMLSPDEQLELDVAATSGRLAIEVDGIIQGYADAGDRLTIIPVPAAAQVIRFGRTSFYERARRKLRVEGSAQVGGGDPGDAVVVDSFEQSRYEILLGGELAGALHYRRHGGRIELAHTEIDQAFEGRGLAGRLAAAALGDARRRSTRVQATCPFVAGYVARHPEFTDLLDREGAPS